MLTKIKVNLRKTKANNKERWIIVFLKIEFVVNKSIECWNE
jgi:hypothetical protein